MMLLFSSNKFFIQHLAITKFFQKNKTNTTNHKILLHKEIFKIKSFSSSSKNKNSWNNQIGF